MADNPWKRVEQLELVACDQCLGIPASCDLVRTINALRDVQTACDAWGIERCHVDTIADEWGAAVRARILNALHCE